MGNDEQMEVLNRIADSLAAIQAIAEGFGSDRRAAASGAAQPGKSSSSSGKSGGGSGLKGIASQGTQLLADTTSPFVSKGTAVSNFALGAASSVLGSGVTQALANVSGIGPEINALQSAEQSTRDLVGRAARAGSSVDQGAISDIFKGFKEVEERNTRAQQSVTDAIGGEQSSALVAALEKSIENGIKNSVKFFNFAFRDPDSIVNRLSGDA
ncbi:MAG: hypothetical protein P1V97_31800 [Planctomycetota bacterium]|nr:hypothetical protein [Planctomycetota bacterium]